MMKISTKGRYGLKAMVIISVEAREDACVSIKSIADRQGISEFYLERIIVPLKKAGLVKSVRGAQGGYTLNKEAKDITVGEILRILEGTLAPADCIDENCCGSGEFSCTLSAGNGIDKACVAKNVWSRIYDSINNVVDSITLEDLTNDFIVANK